MANSIPTPILILGLAAILYGLHWFAQWADRDTRRRRRLDAIKRNNEARDLASLDAMVIDHLRGKRHGKNG